MLHFEHELSDPVADVSIVARAQAQTLHRQRLPGVRGGGSEIVGGVCSQRIRWQQRWWPVGCSGGRVVDTGVRPDVLRRDSGERDALRSADQCHAT